MARLGLDCARSGDESCWCRGVVSLVKGLEVASMVGVAGREWSRAVCSSVQGMGLVALPTFAGGFGD